MKLHNYQILEIFQSEKISDDNTGVYTVFFDKLLDKLSLSDTEKNNILTQYNNIRLYTENMHLEAIARLLDNKIEAFSDDFWELFFFRKHSYSSQYTQRSFDKFNESYEDVKIVKKRVKVLKDFNINSTTLEKFLERLTYQQDGYVDLWFKLNKKEKNKHISDFMKSVILKYGSIDPNEAQKATMLGYFSLVEHLKTLYEENKNSQYRKSIENELSKYIHIDIIPMSLFENHDYHSVIYRKSIPVNKNALLYNLSLEKTVLDKIINVIDQFLNKEIYHLQAQKQEHQHVYTIEAYSEDQLKTMESTVKKSLTHLPQLLKKTEYDYLLKDNTFINDELQHFLKQYIQSADLYKNFNQKFPEKIQQEKKLKI